VSTVNDKVRFAIKNMFLRFASGVQSNKLLNIYISFSIKCKLDLNSLFNLTQKRYIINFRYVISFSNKKACKSTITINTKSSTFVSNQFSNFDLSSFSVYNFFIRRGTAQKKFTFLGFAKKNQLPNLKRRYFMHLTYKSY